MKRYSTLCRTILSAAVGTALLSACTFEQEDYFDDPHILGWVRRGDKDHTDSGLAVVLSNGEGGTKRMFMGEEYAGMDFYDIIGKCPGKVTIGEDGWADFRTDGGSVAVWARKEASENLIINE